MSTCAACEQTVVWIQNGVSLRDMSVDPTPVDPTTLGAQVVVDNHWGYALAHLTKLLADKLGTDAEHAHQLALTYPAFLPHLPTCDVRLKPNAVKPCNAKSDGVTPCGAPARLYIYGWRCDDCAARHHAAAS